MTYSFSSLLYDVSNVPRLFPAAISSRSRGLACRDKADLLGCPEGLGVRQSARYEVQNRRQFPSKKLKTIMTLAPFPSLF